MLDRALATLLPLVWLLLRQGVRYPAFAAAVKRVFLRAGATSASCSRVIQVMEGRHCFAHLSVEDNLITGAYSRPINNAQVREELDRIDAYFPKLKGRRASLAGNSSGGEQQMVAIDRAMMARPKMLLLDEPSMGLAPQVVVEIFEIMRELNQKEGVSIRLAEHNTNVALRHADYGYILESGRIMMDGPAKALAENADAKEFYLGLSSEGRKSFRDIKSYRRRKRWL